MKISVLILLSAISQFLYAGPSITDICRNPHDHANTLGTLTIWSNGFTGVGFTREGFEPAGLTFRGNSGPVTLRNLTEIRTLFIDTNDHQIIFNSSKDLAIVMEKPDLKVVGTLECSLF